MTDFFDPSLGLWSQGSMWSQGGAMGVVATGSGDSLPMVLVHRTPVSLRMVK